MNGLPSLGNRGPIGYQEITKPATYSTKDGEFGFSVRGFAKQISVEVLHEGFVFCPTQHQVDEMLTVTTHTRYHAEQDAGHCSGVYPSLLNINEGVKTTGVNDSSSWYTCYPAVFRVFIATYDYRVQRVFYYAKIGKIKTTTTLLTLTGTKCEMIQHLTKLVRTNTQSCCNSASSTFGDDTPPDLEKPPVIVLPEGTYGYYPILPLTDPEEGDPVIPPYIVPDFAGTPVQPGPYPDSDEPVLPEDVQLVAEAGEDPVTVPGTYRSSFFRTVFYNGEYYLVTPNGNFRTIALGSDPDEIAAALRSQGFIVTPIFGDVVGGDGNEYPSITWTTDPLLVDEYYPEFPSHVYVNGSDVILYNSDSEYTID